MIESTILAEVDNGRANTKSVENREDVKIGSKEIRMLLIEENIIFCIEY